MVRGTKRNKSGKRRFLVFLLMAVITALIYMAVASPHLFERDLDEKPPSNSPVTITPASLNNKIAPALTSIEPEPSVSISSDMLDSSHAILIRIADNSVLLQKNSDEKIYPASLTKMMTAIVALENLSDLKEKIELTNSTFQGLYEADASMAGFLPGERVSAIDLLYGVLLPSGAECCVALADRIAGSEQDFVTLMNKKAADLGMASTHFENATGLHNENHYTTVEDLAVLLSYALQNDTFRVIFTSSRHSTPATNKHQDGITLHSTMFEELNDQNISVGEILGGKTGYTHEAGLCLASLAQVGDQEYILITAGVNGNHHSKQYNIADALAVYDSLGKEFS